MRATAKGKKQTRPRGWRWSLTPQRTMRETGTTRLVVTTVLQNISYHSFRVK